jgi:Pentapeptide repeats (8 copies)
MANPEHLELLKQGIASWNEWRKGNPTSLPDLVRADLSMANLSDADLNRAYLSRADLSDADFNQTRLIDTDLLFGRRSCHKNIDVTKYARMDPDNHFGDSNYCFQGSG